MKAPLIALLHPPKDDGSDDQHEAFPSIQPTKLVADAGAAALARALAPVIYFDCATSFGCNAGGVAHVNLEMVRHLDVAGEPVKDVVTVAMLRFDLNALRRLKYAIEQIEKLVQPGTAPTRN